MFLYEVQYTSINPPRTYLVVAADTSRAKGLVANTILVSERELSVRPANEASVRSRTVGSGVGYWHEKTAWDIYKRLREEGKEAVITNYLF